MKGARRLWGRKISDLGFASFARIVDWERLWNEAGLVKIPLVLPQFQDPLRPRERPGRA
ncbi:MAG: hypothetical protein LBO66_01600 [Deltaproteobacteria bacterium]|nr:hypothetical protein [Deltaproteobacteria bacterium]